MKTKKCVFVKKTLWDDHKDTLMCGLNWKRINNTVFKKGEKEKRNRVLISIKFLAYLSLQIQLLPNGQILTLTML